MNFSKVITTERIVILLFLIVLIWGYFTYSSNKSSFYSAMSIGQDSSNATAATGAPAVPKDLNTAMPLQNSAQPLTNPSDLLPKQSGSWAGQDFVSQNGINIPDLLDAQWMIGLDTTGQSLRNPNYQLRSDPIIPKVNIGPWNQSTIEPDLGRIPLEVGCGSR